MLLRKRNQDVDQCSYLRYTPIDFSFDPTRRVFPACPCKLHKPPPIFFRLSARWLVSTAEWFFLTSLRSRLVLYGSMMWVESSRSPCSKWVRHASDYWAFIAPTHTCTFPPRRVPKYVAARWPCMTNISDPGRRNVEECNWRCPRGGCYHAGRGIPKYLTLVHVYITWSQ